jgi:pyridoxine 5-phosphate synthase
MSPTIEMLKIAIKYKPQYVCIVPEKRVEVTTEGGLNLNKKKNALKNIISKLKKKNIRVTLFIEPKISDVVLSKKLGADSIEIHTGKYCNLFNSKKNTKNEFKKIKKSAISANKIGLDVHAGHGLTYETAYLISRIKCISELNIGHFIIAESVFIGLNNSIKKFKNILKK